MKLFGEKIIKVLGIVILGVSLSACGNKEQTTQAPSQGQNTVTTKAEEKDPDEIIGTLIVYTDRLDMVKTKFAEYKAIFEQENPGTEIVFKAFSDYEIAVTEELNKGDYGDVLLIPHRVSGDQLDSYFEPLGTVEELSETYHEKYLQEAQRDGVVYGLAQYAMPQGIAYNKKVFEKAGIVELPQTPEDFLIALQQIRIYEPQVIPLYTGQRRPQGLAWWQQQVWGAVSGNPDYYYGQMVTDQAPFSEGKPNYIAHKLLYDIVEKGLCEEERDSLNWKTARTMLNNAEIGCLPVEWSEIAALQSAGTNPDDIGYMPFPYNLDGVQYAATTMEYCYAINKNSENKATAKAWIEYMLKSSGYAKSEGAISIRIKDTLPNLLVNFENVEMVVDNKIGIDSMQTYNQMRKLSGILRDNGTDKRQIIEAARQEETDFDDIMKDWNERWQNALQGESSVE